MIKRFESPQGRQKRQRTRPVLPFLKGLRTFLSSKPSVKNAGLFSAEAHAKEILYLGTHMVFETLFRRGKNDVGDSDTNRKFASECC